MLKELVNARSLAWLTVEAEREELVEVRRPGSRISQLRRLTEGDLHEGTHRVHL